MSATGWTPEATESSFPCHPRPTSPDGRLCGTSRWLRRRVLSFAEISQVPLVAEGPQVRVALLFYPWCQSSRSHRIPDMKRSCASSDERRNRANPCQTADPPVMIRGMLRLLLSFCLLVGSLSARPVPFCSSTFAQSPTRAGKCFLPDQKKPAVSAPPPLRVVRSRRPFWLWFPGSSVLEPIPPNYGNTAFLRTRPARRTPLRH